MRILSRTVFREVLTSALLGGVLFTFILFLQKLEKPLEILVRGSATPARVGYLLLLILPPTLTLTVPLSVLVGVLIGLSRMSSDGEIIAMRGSGIPSRRLIPPILSFALLAMLIAGASSLWLSPWSIHEMYRVMNQLAAAQLTADIQPRYFDEQFPNKILYVSDVIPNPGQPSVRWRNVFLADITPVNERPPGDRDRSDEPTVNLATDGIATPDVAHNRIQLNLFKGSTYQVGREASDYSVGSNDNTIQTLEAQKPGEIRNTKTFQETDTLPLYREAYRTPGVERARLIDDRIELNQRLALPLACMLFALIGVPLGISTRKSGKSAAYVITVAMAFLYYTCMFSLINLARDGKLPVPLALWTPNIIVAVAGLILTLRLEMPGDRDWVGSVGGHLRALFRRLPERFAPAPRAVRTSTTLRRSPLFPQLVDAYLLTGFLFYFLLLLSAFVLMTEAFNFFELLSDIMKNNIAMSTVFEYLFFLTPMLIYDSTPLSVLVAVLVTFGVLTKHNEVTALKACGVSLYRLAIPVLLTSSVLAGGLFAFDHYYVPSANQKQDALRAVIKGKPAQTHFNVEQKWFLGHNGERIYYYKYLDPAEAMMSGVSVYEIDKTAFRLSKHISAEKARWEPSLHTWVFYDGWSRDLTGKRMTNFVDFRGKTMTFSELNEEPEYFRQEVKQAKQMNFRELAATIQDLQRRGFGTVELQVQFHKKFSVPLFALIMAMISLPFSFVAGNRGAMAGVGLSFGIAIAYVVINKLFEQVGNISQLPPPVAAWSPDAVFALAGLYFLSRMRT